MLLAIIFLVLWLIGFCFGGAGVWRAEPAYRVFGGSALLAWIEIGILGWVAFHQVLK